MNYWEREIAVYQAQKILKYIQKSYSCSDAYLVLSTNFRQCELKSALEQILSFPESIVETENSLEILCSQKLVERFERSRKFKKNLKSILIESDISIENFIEKFQGVSALRDSLSIEFEKVLEDYKIFLVRTIYSNLEMAKLFESVDFIADNILYKLDSKKVWLGLDEFSSIVTKIQQRLEKKVVFKSDIDIELRFKKTTVDRIQEIKLDSSVNKKRTLKQIGAIRVVLGDFKHFLSLHEESKMLNEKN